MLTSDQPWAVLISDQPRAMLSDPSPLWAESVATGLGPYL